jgi:hypothetical protein
MFNTYIPEPLGARQLNKKDVHALLSLENSWTDFHQILYCRSLNKFLQSLKLHEAKRNRCDEQASVREEDKITVSPSFLCPPVNPPFITKIRIWHLKIWRQQQSELTKLLRFEAFKEVAMKNAVFWDDSV